MLSITVTPVTRFDDEELSLLHLLLVVVGYVMVTPIALFSNSAIDFNVPTRLATRGLTTLFPYPLTFFTIAFAIFKQKIYISLTCMTLLKTLCLIPSKQ